MNKLIIAVLTGMFVAGCTQKVPGTLPINLNPNPTPNPTVEASPTPTDSPADISTNQVYSNSILTVPGIMNGPTVNLVNGSGTFRYNNRTGTVTMGNQFSQYLNIDGSRDVFGSVSVSYPNSVSKTYLTIAKVAPRLIQHTSSIFMGNNVTIQSITPDVVTATPAMYIITVTAIPTGSDPTVSTNAITRTFQVSDHHFVGGESYNSPPITSPNPNVVQ